MKGASVLLASALLLITGCVSPSKADREAAEAPLVASSLWDEYVQAPDGERPFTDFSSAGAFYGEAGLPSLDGWQIFDVADYGAVADDALDDTPAIQRTIDAASAHGGGIVQFGEGRYLLNADPELGSITIGSSGVVLRGLGRERTELHMLEHMPPAEPGKKWTGPAMIRFSPAGKEAPKTNDRPHPNAWTLAPGAVVSAGALTVELSDTSEISAGDYLLFEMQSTKANERYLDGKPTRGIWTTINTIGVALRETHRVARVDGRTVTLDRPLLTELDPALPWSVSKLDLIAQVGVQDLLFSTTWADPFEHHKDARHNSGYRALELAYTVDSWVSNVTFRNVSNAVSIRGGLANSVLLNSIEGNGGHFSFHAEFSTRTLIGMNIDIARGGQWHGPGASHKSAGTVIWRYLSPTSRGIDSHAQFPRQTLFDQVTMAGFGGWGGSYHHMPHHLGGLVLWNFTQTDHARVGEGYTGVLDFWDLPEDDAQLNGFLTAVNPVLAGFRGPADGYNGDNVVLESLGRQVSPASLYEAQIEHRLGRRPAWIDEALPQWRILQEAAHDR